MSRIILPSVLLLLLFSTGVAVGASHDLPALHELAEEGGVTAQYNLGFMYDNGEGVPEDDVQAVFWWRKAAEQGHASAQLNLGFMYDTGEGVPEDDVQAVFWYRKAAGQGHAPAQTLLGFMYAHGEGVSTNYVLAYAWMNIAAAQGNAIAKREKPRLTELMTRAQIDEGQALSRELLAKITSSVD